MKHTASQNQVIKRIQAERESSAEQTCTQHKLTKKQFLSVDIWLTDTFNSFQANVNNDIVVITIGL